MKLITMLTPSLSNYFDVNFVSFMTIFIKDNSKNNSSSSNDHHYNLVDSAMTLLS